MRHPLARCHQTPPHIVGSEHLEKHVMVYYIKLYDVIVDETDLPLVVYTGRWSLLRSFAPVRAGFSPCILQG